MSERPLFQEKTRKTFEPRAWKRFIKVLLNIGIVPIVESRVRKRRRGKQVPMSLSLSLLFERNAFPAPFPFNELPLLRTTSRLLFAKGGLGELFINRVYAGSTYCGGI